MYPTVVLFEQLHILIVHFCIIQLLTTKYSSVPSQYGAFNILIMTSGQDDGLVDFEVVLYRSLIFNVFYIIIDSFKLLGFLIFKL